MSTYKELSLTVSVSLLIVAILTYTHKKQPSCSVTKVQERLFHSLVLAFAGTGDLHSPSGSLVKYLICQIYLFVKLKTAPGGSQGRYCYISGDTQRLCKSIVPSSCSHRKRNISSCWLLFLCSNLEKIKSPISKDHESILWKDIAFGCTKMVLINIYSGWKPEEMLELKKENIDLEEMTMKGSLKTEAGTK